MTMSTVYVFITLVVAYTFGYRIGRIVGRYNGYKLGRRWFTESDNPPIVRGLAHPKTNHHNPFCHREIK